MVGVGGVNLYLSLYNLYLGAMCNYVLRDHMLCLGTVHIYLTDYMLC